MIDQSTANLDPEFRVKVEAMWKDFRAAWLDCFIWEGRRTKERQWQLFWQWRSATAIKKYWIPASYADPTKKIVTWTLDSKHLTGRAIDIVFDADADPKVKVPRWSGNYAKLIEIAKRHWLRSLYPMEMCHIEL